MTKSLMPGLVYATGIMLGTEQFSRANAANMMLIAFGVVVCAIGEVNLVLKGVMQQLAALLFEVGSHLHEAGNVVSAFPGCLHLFSSSARIAHRDFASVACRQQGSHWCRS